MTKRNMQIESKYTITIARTHELTIDCGKFDENVDEFIFVYGLRQLLNDAGSAAKTPDEKLAMAEKKLEALYEGNVRRQGSAKAAVDPVQAEAERLARADIGKMLKVQKRKLSDIDDERLAAAIASHLAKNPEILKTAKARVEALAKTVAKVDLTDLGL